MGGMLPLVWQAEALAGGCIGAGAIGVRAAVEELGGGSALGVWFLLSLDQNLPLLRLRLLSREVLGGVTWFSGWQTRLVHSTSVNG